jgi:hypothetical protein
VCHMSLPSSYRSRRGHIHLLRVLPLVGCRSKTPTPTPGRRVCGHVHMEATVAAAGEVDPDRRPRERARPSSAVCCRHGRGRAPAAVAGAWAVGSSRLILFWIFFLFDVAIIVYRCHNNVLGMLQSFAFMMQSFVIHVAIVVHILHHCS